MSASTLSAYRHAGPCVRPPCPPRLRSVRVFARQNDISQNTGSAIASIAAKLCGAAAATAVLLSSSVAQANTYKVAEWGASGLIFKDSVELLSLEDPLVQGVTIYITDFKRSISEKLAKDFFNEPSQASVTCAITGPVAIKDMDSVKGNDGREIFSERKNVFNLLQNKTLRVRRVYDEKNNTLIYVAYSTRFTSANDEGVTTGRYRTSVCALPLATAPMLNAQQPEGAGAAAEVVAQ